jgi:DNA-directed RNA polymerase subunit M/transcription elongation factor TFIIS
MTTISPRVSKNKIVRLYELDAQGITDETLIADVGYALFFRCESCLEYGHAKEGHAPCPNCGQLITHNRMSNRAVLRCLHCDWNDT